MICNFLKNSLVHGHVNYGIDYFFKYFFFVSDDLQLHGFIGHLEEGGFLPHAHKLYLWTHYTFNIFYNNDKVIFYVQ